MAVLNPPISIHSAPVERSRSLGWWGTISLIATEGMLFALLLFGNFYIRAQHAEWPIGGIEKPNVAYASVLTAILLSSTIPAITAEWAARRNKRGALIASLAVTITLGLVFLAGQAKEYVDQWDEFTPSTNVYGSVFYTITGLHGLHVAIGVIVLSYLLWRTLSGHYHEGHVAPVECGTLYWHFVDVVWIFVFSSLYLSVSLL